MATSSIQASNLFSVDGLVAVITGGGSGIGLMMTRALALNGAHRVYIVGRRKDVLEQAAASVTTSNVIPLVGDVTSKEDLQRIVAHITSDVGYINVLIANSGILGPQAASPITPSMTLAEFQQAFAETSFEDYTQTFKVNVVAVWYTVVAFLGLLDAGNKKGNVAQKSQVIATSSIAGYNRAVPGGYSYGQSKAATTHLMKQLATGLVPFEIRSNVIAPGLYPSDMSANLIGDGTLPKTKVPLERPGTEEDMAGAILFLTSRAGAYITGNVLVTDGGRLSIMPSSY
ncbi:short chain dehydrogenase [Phlyctema vagabunda]|uniref:Short chain dehydrogenase n=1 Tax=Phlyctema vagabunda TaxID=108571 RepID=A0ABR4PEN4_9HELO